MRHLNGIFLNGLSNVIVNIFLPRGYPDRRKASPHRVTDECNHQAGGAGPGVNAESDIYKEITRVGEGWTWKECLAHGVGIAGNRKTKAEDWVLLRLVCYALLEEQKVP